MDDIAPDQTRLLRRVTGFPSEEARALWWYVHNGAHQQCGRTWHCARDRFFGHQIMFMLRGHGHGTYRRRPWAAGPGTAVLMDLRLPHSYHADADDPWEMCWIRMDGPGMAKVFERLMAVGGGPVLPMADGARILEDFGELARLLDAQPPGYDAWVYRVLTGMVANLVEGLRRQGGADPALEGNAPPEGIDAAVAYLRNQHQEPLTVEDLAQVAHMSISHFIRRFKAATGFTPMEYLEKFRIGRAQELMLEHADLRLNEVARAVGYDDPAYFSRVFRKRAGLSPRAFRQQQARG